MRFTCESCDAQYMIPDEKVGPRGVRVRCKRCGNVVLVTRPPAAAPEAPPPEETPAAPPASAGAEHESTLERELGAAFDSAFGMPGGAGGEQPGAAAAEAATLHRQEEHARQDDGATAIFAATPGARPGPASPSAESFSDWYVAIKDRQVGPLPAPGVRSRWEAGEIGPDTLAWRPGLADWRPLSSIEEMAEYLSPAPRPRVHPEEATAPSPSPRASAGEADRGAQPEAASGRTEPTPSRAAGVAGAGAVGAAGTVAGAAGGAPAALQGFSGVASAPSGGETWRPGAASALAALAGEEMASLGGRSKQEPEASQQGESLVDRMGLPEGGVDPTNVLPLPIKGLDPTSERALSHPAGATAEGRQRQAAVGTRPRRWGIVLGAVAALAVAAALAAVLWPRSPAEPRPRTVGEPPALARAEAPAAAGSQQAAPAPTPPPAALAAAPPASAPAAAAPVAAAPSEAQPAVATPAAAAAPVAAAAAAAGASAPAKAAEGAPAPAAKGEAAVARAEEAAPRPARAKPRPVKAEQAAGEPARPPRRTPPRVAAAEALPAPAPAAAAPAQAVASPPAPRKAASDPLLDVEGDDVDKELAGKAPKRSVYVPPAVGGDLPESVTVSQINEAVAGQKAALIHCTEQQRAASPDTSGTLRLRWTILGDGSARDVRNLSEELDRQPIAPCISGVVKGIRFPRSRTAGQEVVFPFKF